MMCLQELARSKTKLTPNWSQHGTGVHNGRARFWQTPRPVRIVMYRDAELQYYARLEKSMKIM
jgi:hypothetical protein